jgi:hypothetical protein
MKSHDFAVIDCETDPFRPGRVHIEPFVWGYYDKEGFRTFAKSIDLVRFISDKPITVYAHNGGKFDFHFLLDWVNSEDEVTKIHGRIARARIGVCEIRDSFCLFPDKLSAWKKDEIDYDKFERDVRDVHFREIVKYLEGDCRYLYELIEGFREAYGTSLTLASAALTFWAEHFNNKQKPKMAKSSEGQADYYERWSRYYFGGRVQVREPGIHVAKIDSWDINSAYPYAMTHDHPAGPNAFASKIEGPGLERKLITLTGPSRGFFPVRKKTGGIWFPEDGEIRRFNVTGWEYIAACELGFVANSIEEVWEFAATRNFTPYVDHFWKIKNKAEKGSSERLWAKLFLNGLYGKFAANPQNYDRTFLVDFSNAWDFSEKIGGQISGTCGARAIVSAPLLPQQIRYYDVVTGLSITGFVRAVLMKAAFNHRTLYMDTDNIKQIGPCHLPAIKGLGGWEHEGTYTKAIFAGPKLYGMENENETDPDKRYKFASKGIALPPNPKIAMAILERLAKGGEYTSNRIAPSYSLGANPRLIERTVRMTS